MSNIVSSQICIQSLLKNEKYLNKHMRRLSIGEKITGAGDSPAAYQISEKMRVLLRSLEAVDANLKHGTDLTTLATKALDNIFDILKDMKALALQSANDTNSNIDRECIQQEITQRLQQIDTIAYYTNYNGTDGVHPLVESPFYKPDTGYISTIQNYHVQNTESPGNPIRQGMGALTLYASNEQGNDTVIGSLGTGSSGTMFRVSDGVNTEKIYLNKTAYINHLTKTVHADQSVSYVYDDGNMQFEILQKVSVYNETDETSGKGSSFFNIQYEFINKGTNSLQFDMVTGIDPFNGNFTASIPYAVNGTQHTDQFKDNPSPGFTGNYEITYPQTSFTGMPCDVVTRLIGNGIDTAPDQIMVWGEAVNANGIDDLWTDIDSIDPSSNSSDLDVKSTDDVLAVWKGCTVAAGGGSYATNILHGITYPVISSDSDRGKMWIQSGTKSNHGFFLPLVNATTGNLNLSEINLSTEKGSMEAITNIDNAVNLVNKYRTHFGSFQNRMEYGIANEKTMAENIAAAESVIRDVNMASEMTAYMKSQLLLHAAQSMCAQANSSYKNILSLLK